MKKSVAVGTLMLVLSSPMSMLVSGQQLPGYGSSQVAGDTALLSPVGVIQVLDRFQAQYGYFLNEDLYKRLNASLDVYHDSTLAEAQRILQAEQIPPKERLYELDVFLRSHEEEWTIGTAGKYVGLKAADAIKDRFIMDAVTLYAPYIGVPMQLISTANSVFSFLPGFAVGYGDDLVAYFDNEQNTERHRRVYEFLIQCRSSSSDEIAQRIRDHRARIDAINEELLEMPKTLRQTVMAELPSSVERLMPGFERTWFWDYVRGEPLPPSIRAQIEQRLAGTPDGQFRGLPDWHNWVSSANDHFREAGLKSLALVREQIMLVQLNDAAEVALESRTPSGSETRAADSGTMTAERGYWFASSLPTDWQVERNQKGAWTATVWRVIAPKSGNCPEQRANGSVSVELENASSAKDRDELGPDLYKRLESSGLYLEPEALESYSLTGPGRENFSGKLLHSRLKYTPGYGSPTVGYRSGRANFGGFLTAIEPDRGRMIRAVYTASAPHCWDNSGADGARAEAQALRSQAVQILKSLTLRAEKADSATLSGPRVDQPVVVNDALNAPQGTNADMEAPGRSQPSDNQRRASSSPSSLGMVSGVWKLSANGFAGLLTITDAGASVSFTGGRSQETLQDVSFAGGVLEFTRPAGGAVQRYSGKLQGRRFEGTFTQKGSDRSYPWSAEIE